MEYLNYVAAFFDEAAIIEFESGLKEITDWNKVQKGTYMYRLFEKDINIAYRFDKLFVGNEGKQFIRYTKLKKTQSDIYALETNLEKWFFWDENLWLRILKKQEMEHNLSWFLKEVVVKGDIETIDKVLMLGYDLERKTSSGETVFFIAVRLKNMPVVKRLVEAGADIGVLDKHNQNVLHIACMHNKRKQNVELITYLLTLPIPLEVKNTDSQTPFQVLCTFGGIFPTMLTKLFREKGAYLHGKDVFGYSTLASSIENNHLEVIQLLIENGADINESTEDEEHIMGHVKSTKVYEFFAERMDELTPLGKEKLMKNRLKLLFQ